MRKIMTVICLLWYGIFNAQIKNCEKIDTIVVNEIKHPTYYFSSEISLSGFLNIFVVDIENFEKVKKMIPKIYSERKQEHTECYVLGVYNLKEKSSLTQSAISVLVNNINVARKKRENPYIEEIKTTDTKNIHFLYKPEEICKYMFCK